MSENIFQQVRGINELAGNPLAVDIVDLLKQGKIIQSELYEFLQGLADYDLKEIRDGQGDIIFTALGLPGRSGFPYVGDMQTICDNQFAKFDLSAEDAEKTRAKYLAEGVETTWHQGQYDGRTYYVTTSAKDQLYRGKPIGKGKWLKSWKWQEPEFAPIDPVRTPWTNTGLPEQKLISLKAELAIQGYIAKYGSVDVLAFLDDAYSDKNDDEPVYSAVVADTGLATIVADNVNYSAGQASLTDDQAAAITGAMDELDSLRRLRAINSPMPSEEYPSMCQGDTGDSRTLRELMQEVKTKPSEAPVQVTPEFKYGTVDSDIPATDISKGADNATI